jgi:hypothetical protein
MQKTPSLFKRDYEGTRLVYDEVVPGSEWVSMGEGMATVKVDGTSCMIRGGKFYKRYELKKGKQAPQGFEPAQDPDPVTGDIPGWVTVSENEPADRWHLEGRKNALAKYGTLADGTYELMGPKIQNNPEKLAEHILVRHGERKFDQEPPRDYEGLKAWFATHEVEGIVWHHPDGRMVKIKRRDFGYPWPIKG